MAKSASKKRTNVTIDCDVLDGAREFDLNVSAIAEKAVRQAVSEAKAAAWQAENAHALEMRRIWHEEHGLPLAGWQVWTPGE